MLAAVLGRGRGQGPTDLRLGLHHLTEPTTDELAGDTDRAGYRWLLIRGHPRTGELAYYRCYSPIAVPLAELVRVAGARWTVEETFQGGNGLAGPDEH